MFKQVGSSIAALLNMTLIPSRLAFLAACPGFAVTAAIARPPGPRGNIDPAAVRVEIAPNSGGALTSISLASSSLASMSIGKVWVKTHPAGEVSMQASIVANGIDIGRLELDPSTGSPLIKGYKVTATAVAISLDQAKAAATTALRSGVVLAGAEFNAHEGAWKLAIASQGMVIAHIHVTNDGTSFVQDYGTAYEALYYGE